MPVIAGTNRDEQKLFMFMNPLHVRRWLGVVPQVRDPELYLAAADARSAMWKATGADGPVAAMWATQPNVFVYRFDWDEEPSLLGIDLGTFLGAAHGFEIPFVFGHWDLGRQGNVIFSAANQAGREALSDQMMSYWANFARTGDPGRGRRGELPAWSAWDGRPQAHKYLILDTEARRRPAHGLRAGDGRERARVRRRRPAPRHAARPLFRLPRAGALGRSLRQSSNTRRPAAKVARSFRSTGFPGTEPSPSSADAHQPAPASLAGTWMPAWLGSSPGVYSAVSAFHRPEGQRGLRPQVGGPGTG